MKRTAVVDGTVLSIGLEKAGSPVIVAQLDFGGMGPSMPGSHPAQQPPGIDLNATSLYVSEHGAMIALRAADLTWLGKKCRLTVTVEVL